MADRKIWTFFLFVLITHAFADDVPLVVVSGAKIEQTLDETVEKVDVVTADDIEKRGSKTLSEALEGIAGIVVSGHPADSISMQGLSGEYVKIMIDGVEVAGDIAGAVASFQIPVEDIERIEIVQGASSALFGSDALGGVVNIITKKKGSKESGYSCSLTQSFSSAFRSYSAGTLGKSGEHLSTNISVSFDYDAGNSVETYTALLGNVNQYLVPYNRLGSIRGNMFWEGDSKTLLFSGSYSNSRQIVNTTVYETMQYESSRFDGTLSGDVYITDYSSVSGFFSVKGYLLETDFENKVYDTNTITDTDFLDYETEVRLSFDPGIRHSMLFGVNGSLETISGDSFDGLRKTLVLSSFAQNTWNVFGTDRLMIVPGLRVDISPPLEENDSFLYQITPKISGRYSVTENALFRFSYGMGYKIPSLKHKYWVFLHTYASGEGNFILYGNTDLEPERSHGFNIGFEKKYKKLWEMDVSAYCNLVHNLIDTEIVGHDGSRYIRTYVNIGKAITYGGQVSIHVVRGAFSSNLSYAYAAIMEYSESDGEYVPLASGIPHRITASIAYKIPVIDLDTTAHASWNSPQLLERDSDTNSPDFLMLSGSLGKSFAKEKYALTIQVDNILNNTHFFKGTDGDDQKSYFGLHDGVIVTASAKINL